MDNWGVGIGKCKKINLTEKASNDTQTCYNWFDYTKYIKIETVHCLLTLKVTNSIWTSRHNI